MKLSTAMNKRTRAVTSSNDAISVAAIGGLTSKVLHAMLRETLTNMGQAPQWAIAYVRGFQDCLTKALYRTDLVHGGYVDGVFMSTHRSRPDYYETCGIGPKEWNDTAKDKGHYWGETRTRGIKPFFVDGARLAESGDLI